MERGLDEFERALEGARRGDDGAFAVLWRRYQPSLLRYLRVVAGAAAEDLASETWVDVVRGLDRFTGDEPGFRGWLFTIARRRHIDWRRSARRRPVSAGDAALPEMAAVEDTAATVDEHLGLEDAMALIRSLPPDQAEVVALRAIAGLDVGAVADLLGKRPGAVRVLCHRGLRRLAERTAPTGEALEV